MSEGFIAQTLGGFVRGVDNSYNRDARARFTPPAIYAGCRGVLVDADWFNRVQRELIDLVTGPGR